MLRETRMLDIYIYSFVSLQFGDKNWATLIQLAQIIKSMLIC